jgi:hypothetical protein
VSADHNERLVPRDVPETAGPSEAEYAEAERVGCGIGCSPMKVRAGRCDHFPPRAAPVPPPDPVNHPPHYTAHPSGVEAITICEHMGFNLGNAMKYIWRADLKGAALEDLRKAIWYIQRELSRRERQAGK